MYVIGVTAYYHDSSACLFKNGQLIFACEEEKFTGIKHDSSFPTKTLDYILLRYKINEYKLTPKLFMSCNPTNSWLKSEFYTPHINETLEPYLPTRYILKLPDEIEPVPE